MNNPHVSPFHAAQLAQVAEQERLDEMLIKKLCSFLSRVAAAGVRQNSVGLDGRVPVQSLIEQGFAKPEYVARLFINTYTREYPLDGAHLKLYGGFYWVNGKREGSIELTCSESRANFPNFSKDVDELIVQYFPQRNSNNKGGVQ